MATGEPAEARETAGELWDEIRPPKPGRSGPEPASLVAQMRWPAFVLLQSARLSGGPDKPDLSELRDEWWTANVLYNLACYHARKTLLPAQSKVIEPSGIRDRYEDLAKARRYLRDGIDRATEPKLMLAMAKTDPVLDEVVDGLAPQDLADLTGQSPDDRDPRDDLPR